MLAVALGGRLAAALAVLRGHRRWTAAVATVAISAYPVCFFAGVSRAGVAVGTLVGIGSVPVWTGLLLRLRGRRLGRRWAVGTTGTLAGVALLVGPAGGDIDAPGIPLALAAGAAYATYTLASERLLRAGHGPTETMAATYGAGAVLLAPLATVAPLGWAATPAGVSMVLWLGVATVAVAYVLYARGLSRLSSATVATLTLTEPLVATLLAVAVLGERLGGRSALGAATVAAGLVTVSLTGRRVPRHDERMCG